MATQQAQPETVSPEQWQAAHERLLAKEKEETRARDALAAERRRMPRLSLRGDYAFDGPDGRVTLLDLFEGRRQLILYSFMFEPGSEPCSGCSMFSDQVGHLAHLHARDTTLALVSRAPLAEIAPFRERMGWAMPWYSLADESFYTDIGVKRGFALNVFLREGNDVFRTYRTSGRGVEALGSVWSFLDLTPFGRQEEWEDSPPGTRQTPTYHWWNLHDEYGAAR